MTVLIIAEHDNQQLKPDTAKVITAAKQLGDDIHILVAGNDCQSVATEAATLNGVTRVLLADNPAYGAQLAENMAKLIVDISTDYTHILAGAGSQGKDILPRVAALLDVAQLSDVVAIDDSDTFIRPIYAGNALAKVKSLDAIKVITVRSSVFDAVTRTGQAEIVSLETVYPAKTELVSQTLTVSERPELGSAAIVVSGGRGMGSGENFALLETLADKLGAAVGASRAAVDAGFVPNDLQVGQTGKIVAPDLYIAVGISGAIQHLAGMKDAKVIVAINKDPDAPIFQVADYGLTMDLFEAVPALTGLIKSVN